MISPTDVALNMDETKAYVVDMESNYAFVFERSAVGLEEPSDKPVTGFRLLANYPNPFNPETVIRYRLPVSSDIELAVFDVRGQNIATLVTEKQPAGSYQVRWNAAGLPSGVYFCRLVNGGQSAVRKMILIQ